MTALPLSPPPGVLPPDALPLAQPGVMAPAPTLAPPAMPGIAAPTRVDASVRVLLVEELDQVASHINGLLDEDEDVQLVERVSEGRAAHERIAAVEPDVIVIDALMQGTVTGLQLAHGLRAARVATPIIFMTVPELPVKLNAEMGIAEVVMLPLDGDALRSAIVRVDDALRGSVAIPPSGTVAVFSGMGGVGRTTIAHNLAAALNLRPATRAVLVDGNQVHGDLRLHLGAPETAPSLLQLPTGKVTDADVAPLLWRDPSGVDVLLAPPRLEQADLVLLRDLETALTALKTMYDVVVIDVPAAMNDMTLAMLDHSDVILDVVTTQKAALRKSQRCRAALVAAGFSTDSIVTVVNRADGPGVEAGELSAQLGQVPAATLPVEPRLDAGEVADGSSIVLTDPMAAVSTGLAGLAALLAARVQGDVGAAAARAA